ncbi:GNAT family N-acyltransferase [Aestuariirhabdus sp. LZHN29]|uniref:GNAT family N-acyltransferase n=1 Tax=Aestuariirhabdus sp. LZHN29 TaxID=3417462 RepID=UPI003CFAD29A
MNNRLYEVFVADTEFAKTINYHVRYQVYCEQKQYESPCDEFIDQERDEWDERSVHFIVRDQLSGEWCAALRLVKPVTGLQLPLENISKINEECIRGKRHQAVELSRLCKPKSGSYESLGKRTDGEVIQALVSSVARYCHDHGYDELFCLTSPSIVRLMPRRWKLNAVGPAAEHRGLRRPYWLDIDSILDFCDEKMPDVGYRNFSCAFGGNAMASVF